MVVGKYYIVFITASTREADFIDNGVMDDADVDRELEDSMNLHLMKLAHQETERIGATSTYKLFYMFKLSLSISHSIRYDRLILCLPKFSTDNFTTPQQLLFRVI